MLTIKNDDVRGHVYMDNDGHLVACVDSHSYATEEQAEDMLIDAAIAELISWHKPDLSDCDTADMYRKKTFGKVA